MHCNSRSSKNLGKKLSISNGQVKLIMAHQFNGINYGTLIQWNLPNLLSESYRSACKNKKNNKLYLLNYKKI